MRTTLTLEPDVERLIRRSMRERNIGMKQAVNEAIRHGLEPDRPDVYDFPTFDLGITKDLTKVWEVLGELDDEEFMRITREA